MKKFFLAGLIWELLRFIFLVFLTQKKAGIDTFLWIASQQLVLFYLYFFLWYNKDRYCQYMKAAAAGKFIGVASGAVYIAQFFIKGKMLTAGIVFTFNIILIDAVFMIILIFIIKKYFEEQLRVEDAGNTNSQR
ncbi:MAG: hypothetical protein H7A26_08475 [Spirochaetales bacterium]|nr:hypothetical protein [Spirochaetales bacterium]